MRACYIVIIACRQPAECNLADAQVAGGACIRCHGARYGELIPVGVIVPASPWQWHSHGEQCVLTLFTS